MEQVASQDGTSIAFDRSGEGPPVVLVCGGSVDRTSLAGLAALLEPNFTVFNYDRRGRGPSGDTPPYAVQREVEDIGAVIAAAGGSAFLFGSSSGAALALVAAASGLPVTKLALWEPPYILDPAFRPPASVAQYERMMREPARRRRRVLHGEGRRCPPSSSRARATSLIEGTEALAHTLAYDATAG
jgi:pimeloyl-ACP methyl ester carboxylesterase